VKGSAPDPDTLPKKQVAMIAKPSIVLGST
jgi:hypothetical protein